MTTPRKRTPRAGTHQAAQVSKLLDRTDVQTTDHATPARANTQPTRDEINNEVLTLIDQLDREGVMTIAALITAILDSEDGLLLARDEASFRDALATLRVTGDSGVVSQWLLDRSYLPVTDSKYVNIHIFELAAQERAQGGSDGE